MKDGIAYITDSSKPCGASSSSVVVDSTSYSRDSKSLNEEEEEEELGWNRRQVWTMIKAISTKHNAARNEEKTITRISKI